MSTHIRAAVCALIVTAALIASSALPAQAASSYLCKGYTACAAAGMSSSGYQAVAKNKYWLMTPGHNCTNYAAYRMVLKGLANKRPWTGSGMAYNWGPANVARMDKTPVVGAVAWWTKNVKGAGSSGHVAYVERVVSIDEIILSEDNWGGNFDWRRVRRASGWPGGFIHFKDTAIGAPRGATNSVTSAAAGRLTLQGWAFDPNKTAQALGIRAYVGGPPGTGQLIILKAAKVNRPDVARAYPGAGSKHGFRQTVKVKRRGTVMVYLYALNVGKTSGVTAFLGRKQVTVKR